MNQFFVWGGGGWGEGGAVTMIFFVLCIQIKIKKKMSLCGEGGYSKW